MTDWQLLREYAEKNSEAAFACLVDRHMKLVYGTCRRDLGNPQLAEDAAQAVFLLLAQKAKSLRRHVSIPGWLFNAARLVARNSARVERRRRHYEQEAVRSMEHGVHTEARREEIDPWLNDALSALKPADREMVLMRYFDDLTFQEIASQTGMAENTAAQRATRAIEKMRHYMAKKEVTISAAALAALLADHRAEAASDSCRAATLRAVHDLTTGQTAALAASPHLTLLQKGVYFTMLASKYKITGGVCAAVLAALLVTGAAYQHDRASRTAAGPLVQWMAPRASDPAERSTQQQIQAQIGRFINGFNSRNPAGMMAGMTPDCVLSNPGQSKPESIYSDLAGSGQAFFAHTAPDSSMRATINSCRINGNTAVVGLNLFEHGVDSSEQGNGPVLYYDSDKVCVMTFVNTGGYWLISDGENTSSTQSPYSPVSGVTAR